MTYILQRLKISIFGIFFFTHFETTSRHSIGFFFQKMLSLTSETHCGMLWSKSLDVIRFWRSSCNVVLGSEKKSETHIFEWIKTFWILEDSDWLISWINQSQVFKNSKKFRFFSSSNQIQREHYIIFPSDIVFTKVPLD